MSQALDSLGYFAVLGLLCGIVSFRLGLRVGARVGLPVVQAVLGYLAFAASWRAAGSAAAAVAVTGWAIGSSVVAVGAFRRDPDAAGRVVGAGAFGERMFRWLDRGSGARGGAPATVSRWVQRLALVLLASTMSAGLGAIAVGAMMLNAMNAWVAALIGRAGSAGGARALGWNVWSAVRVAALAALGSACAAPLAGRLGYPPSPETLRVLLASGAAAAIADLLLELALSEVYRARLSAALGRRTEVSTASEPRQDATATH